MDAKLQMETFENVMQLAIEGCKAVASYIREVRLVTCTEIISYVHFFIFYFCDKFCCNDRYYWKTPSSWSRAGVHNNTSIRAVSWRLVMSTYGEVKSVSSLV